MNYALYYPSIEFQNYSWLWSAALLWDRIYRIVPAGFTPDEPDNVRALTEAGEIGIPIHPDSYVERVAEEFLSKVRSGRWPAAALNFNVDKAYAKLHSDKVDVQLRKMLIAKGTAVERNEWLHVPTEFETLYMTYLARRVSVQAKLQLVSDCEAAWTGSTYFRYDGRIEELPSQDLTHQLATLVVRDFIPENILEIRPDALVKFREKYSGERQEFMEAVRNAAQELANCEDEGVYRDRIHDLKKGIEKSLHEYKKSMRTLKVAAWTGMGSLLFPVTTNVATLIAGKGLGTTTLEIISEVGIGLGLVSGLVQFRQKKRLLEGESDWSYLLHMHHNWKGCARYGNDYNYLLCRNMEEFIND